MRIGAPVPHHRAVAWFSVVGGLIGLAVGGVFAAMHELTESAVVAGAAAVIAGLLITGAFHEDGLADMSDAVAGGTTREDKLRILDDARLGTYGVAALTSSIVLRAAALASMPPAAGLAATVAAHTLGRAAAISIIGRVDSARRSGLGATAAEAVREPGRTLGAVAGMAICALATGWWVAVLIPVAALGTTAVVSLARRAFGGINGDVLGAVEQVTEIAVLIAMAALAPRHELWWR
ncbi:MAG: adenosylcobinamide-GDP ribazoletransferase [Actinomycetota bacterium]|nr:adenosylcobinamide-GDP ribazoletransferase [Actinomycetota bacterium]